MIEQPHKLWFVSICTNQLVILLRENRIYHIVGMFGEVNVWRIAELKIIGKIKFGEWIDFGHKDTIYKLKFSLLKFDESRKTRQICQAFPLPNIPSIQK